MLHNIRFIGGVAALYIATIGLAGYLISSAHLLVEPVHAQPQTKGTTVAPSNPQMIVISGKPIRIIIPDYEIDLPVDEGVYINDGEWTLSETRAQFALMSALANDRAGNTFIYGHGTDQVFGKLASTRPPIGTLAQIYTQEGDVFSYRFTASQDLTPNDTAILDNMSTGHPRLTVQTCTGLWSEWRTIFTFDFEKVEKAQ